MEYIFYVNPTAGKGQIQNTIISSVKKYFNDKNEQFEILVTKEKGEAETHARMIAQSGKSVRMFACGGEGTVFEVLNGIVGYDNVELGVIPCGSANDFLKFFESREPFADIDAQIKGEVIPVDIIKANDRYCLNGCSVGMDAVVAKNMTLFKRWPLVSGSMAYKLAIVKTFLGKIGITANISLDGGSFIKSDCLFATVSNAPYYGGGYKSAPKAVPFDGKLNFTLVSTISKFKILRFLPLYEKGEHTELECCTLKDCENMEFTSEKPIPVNLDGEIIESDHMRFEIVKSGLKFVAPSRIYEKMLINVK